MPRNLDFIGTSEFIGYEPYTQEFDQIRHISEILAPEEIDGIHSRLTAYRGSPRDEVVAFSRAVVQTSDRIAAQFEEAGVDPAETTVTLLIDGSGSTRGSTAINFALATTELCIALEKLGVETSVLGYTTSSWKGGASRENWVKAGREPNPGRLCDLLHIVYKRPEESVRESISSLSAMTAESTKKENIDGEALMWAAGECMETLDRPNKILINVTDGFWPIDDSTLVSNPESLLLGHVMTVANMIEDEGRIALAGVYVDLNDSHRKACLDLKEKGRTIFPRDTMTSDKGNLTETFSAMVQGLALGIRRAAEINAGPRHTEERTDIDSGELLEAAGFERLENGLWRFAIGYENTREGGNETAVVIVEERRDGTFAGYVPLAEFQTLEIEAIPERSLFFPSADPRDMVALAQNEAASASCQATGHWPDEGFADNDDDTFITMPFMGGLNYNDYAIVEGARKDDVHVELVPPGVIFNEYKGWRDEFCAKLMAKPAAGL